MNPKALNVENIVGTKYGRRTAIEYRGPSRNGHIFLFKCDCGKEDEVPLHQILRGERTSCGLCANVANRKKRVFNATNFSKARHA